MLSRFKAQLHINMQRLLALHVVSTVVAGEVVNVSIGKKRLAQYAAEGLKHTYIMDLSKNEVIDATKKGGTARFINHSCEPNCKTEKWQVGIKVCFVV